MTNQKTPTIRPIERLKALRAIIGELERSDPTDIDLTLTLRAIEFCRGLAVTSPTVAELLDAIQRWLDANTATREEAHRATSQVQKLLEMARRGREAIDRGEADTQADAAARGAFVTEHGEAMSQSHAAVADGCLTMRANHTAIVLLCKALWFDVCFGQVSWK